MIEIISPQQFKTVPWKNGRGETIELSISEGGTLERFDWRISIASVVEDGLFSDFSGYDRTLILVKGNGITLQHADETIAKLSSLLNVAKFDGGLKTSGILHSGPISDFNIISDKKKLQAAVHTYVERQDVRLGPAYLSFVYCLASEAKVSGSDGRKIRSLKHGSLMKITQPSEWLSISGRQMIVASLNLN